MFWPPENFILEELVCKHVFDKWGYNSWSFFDDRALRTIDIIRRRLNKRMIINNWKWGGEFTQRGLRCNQCQLVKDKTTAGIVYCTPHVRGIAFDFDVEGMVAEEVRQWLIMHKEILPVPIRLEAGVNWVHLDIAPVPTLEKITLFNP